jgi:hypothetical protein
LGPIGVDLCALDQQVLGNRLVGDDNKVVSEHLCPVERSICVGPFSKLESHLLNGQVVSASHPWHQGWSRWLGRLVFPGLLGLDLVEE